MSNHDGRHCVLPALDQFQHNGPNGEHVCFVFDVMGYHLGYQSAKYEDGRIPVASVKSVVRQLLLGLDFLHRECGIIHTGMTKPIIPISIEKCLHTALFLTRFEADKYSYGITKSG